MKTRQQNGVVVICLATSIFFVPSTALALGDPLALFSMLGIGILHAILGGIILLSKLPGAFRTPAFIIYLSVVVMAWLWGMDSSGPNFGEMYMRLAIGPIITFICLMWIIAEIHKKDRVG